jgi:sortase A
MYSGRSQPGSQLVLRWCSLVFLLAGAGLLAYYGYVSTKARIFQTAEAQRFRESRSLQSERSSSDCQPAAIYRGDSIGRIEIPRIGLSVVVLEGDDAQSLRQGAGRVPGTAHPGEMGNMAIAAHRDSFFRPLRDVRKGDIIRFVALSGSYTYSLEFTEIVGPTRTDVLSNTPGRSLTLITCYPFYFIGPAPDRFVVRARQVSFEPLATMNGCPRTTGTW